MSVREVAIRRNAPQKRNNIQSKHQTHNHTNDMKTSARLFLSCTALLLSAHLEAQTFTHISSSEGNTWQQAKVRMQSSPRQIPLLDVTDATAPITTFRAWGATFNELDWDALGLLTRNEQDEILHNVFAPDGDLRIARGRISMGANDYARSWYSCDEMEGDFELRYFNIDRDKQAIIPFVRAAQKYNPDLTCWVSPWCPPSWMKINGDYPVLSSPYNNLPEKMNYLLYGQTGGETDPDEMKLTGERNGKFPKKLATTDYMIQDPRYLQTYANMFCKFIDAYREQGIRIDMVMYQNEAYSYTPYPGCAWTAEGTIRFNRDYLAPTLKRLHPDVKLYLGTFNTNRQDYVEKILADPQLQSCISGMGFQWEGREILPEIRRQHPDWSYICSESECGWGSFDWKAAEHTFELMNHYLGNGCNEYIFWNFILADNGESPWGWKQNALIRVDSRTRTYTYTPEYYAAKHYSHFIGRGTQIIGYHPASEGNTPVLVAKTAEGKTVVVAGNFNDEARTVSLKLGNRYLNIELAPHSFNTLTEGR